MEEFIKDELSFVIDNYINDELNEPKDIEMVEKLSEEAYKTICDKVYNNDWLMSEVCRMIDEDLEDELNRYIEDKKEA